MKRFLEDRLVDEAEAVHPAAHVGHELRLHVGREAGCGAVLTLTERIGPLRRPGRQPGTDRDVGAALGQFFEQRVEHPRVGPLGQARRPPVIRAGQQQRARLDPVAP